MKNIFKKISKKEAFNEAIKPIKRKSKKHDPLRSYMDYLGILHYKITPVNYYSGENDLYIVEADYLETYFLKIFSDASYKYSSSIEKHFITSVKNIAKLTPNVNVSYDGSNDNNNSDMKQFLFTDRLAGANKKWSNQNAEEKSQIIKEIAKLMYKIHSYSSKRVMKDEIFGTVPAPKKTWAEYLKDHIDKKVIFMEDSKENINKFKSSSEDKISQISTMKIPSVILHCGISLNKDGYIKSLLFLGTKISGVVNAESSIYGDKMWDIAYVFKHLIGKNETLVRDFKGIYGKFTDDEKFRLDFYKKII